MLKIIDYGMSNLGSVFRAFKLQSNDVGIATDATQIESADSLVLPGVGSFKEGMERLRQGGWIEAIGKRVSDSDVPVLGICLGMHFLATYGDEGGGSEGLDLIPGRVVHLRDIGCRGRVPHVGWNDVRRADNDCVLLKGIPEGTDFYFVHSYAYQTKTADDAAAMVEYGAEFPAIVGRDKRWGVQFHPEKSSAAGIRLIRNFLEV